MCKCVVFFSSTVILWIYWFIDLLIVSFVYLLCCLVTAVTSQCFIPLFYFFCSDSSFLFVFSRSTNLGWYTMCMPCLCRHVCVCSSQPCLPIGIQHNRSLRELILHPREMQYGTPKHKQESVLSLDYQYLSVYEPLSYWAPFIFFRAEIENQVDFYFV